jgi:hypothetical protein
MTFITHGFRVPVVSDERERVRDFRITFALLRRSSLVECVIVLHGTCLQSVEFFFIRQYVQPCLSKNPKYIFYAIKSSLTLTFYGFNHLVFFQIQTPTVLNIFVSFIFIFSYF